MRKGNKKDMQQGKAGKISLIISVSVVALFSGYLIYSHFSGQDKTQPKITIKAQYKDAYKHGGDYYLPIEVKNTGDKAAADVIVDITQKETVAEMTFIFLDGGESEKGYAVLPDDPKETKPELAVLSFLEP